MATWITHLMVADGVLDRYPRLSRRSFCVGNIAPDCNVENADWTSFTPSREVTHWMRGERKEASDADAFCNQYILNRRYDIGSAKEYAFLIGYYSHLITDAAYQAMTRDEERVKAMWRRIRSDDKWGVAGACMGETWDSAKKLVPKEDRMREIYTIETEYLCNHPDSGYLTEILPLRYFPDYIDYLPQGSIVRKISIMGYMPKLDKSIDKYIVISKNEYTAFVEDTIQLVIKQLVNKNLLG